MFITVCVYYFIIIYIYIYIILMGSLIKSIWYHVYSWWLLYQWDPSIATRDGRSVWTTKGTLLKNEPNLVTFYESILVLWTSQLTLWVEWLPLAQKTGVQSLVESYQRLKKWYLMPPYLTLSIIRYDQE